MLHIDVQLSRPELCITQENNGRTIDKYTHQNQAAAWFHYHNLGGRQCDKHIYSNPSEQSKERSVKL